MDSVGHLICCRAGPGCFRILPKQISDINDLKVAKLCRKIYNEPQSFLSDGDLNCMEQNEALVRQEAMPENNPNVEEQPSEKNPDMETLLQEEGLTLDFPKEGEIRTGTIASIGQNEILVSIGTKSEGIISGREKELIPAEELKQLEVGQEIPVYVLDPEDQNGNVVLSYVRAREERDWYEVEALMESGEIHEGKIIGYNKGGLIVPIGSLRGFVPASQVSVLRRIDSSAETPEQRWGKMVGEPIQVRVIEVDRERRRLILSERSALQETRETLKDRLLEELEEGTVRTGRVTSLADFGAFVNIDGADGLVHLSEITWERIQHPNEVLKVGQEVKVKVISMDRERKRIGLSIRQLLPDPWMKKIEGIKEGMLLEGAITHLTKFGAFARIGEELEGLIHVSELSEQRVNHPKEVVKEGDVVTMRVIKIDPERRRIGLSLRKVDSPAYADLDWKMALAEEIGDVHPAPADQEEAEGVSEEAQAEEPQKEEALESSEAPQEEVAVQESEVVQDIEPVSEQPGEEVVSEESPVAEAVEEEAAGEESPVAEAVEEEAAGEESPVVEAVEEEAAGEESPVVEAVEEEAAGEESPVVEAVEEEAAEEESPVAEAVEEEAAGEESPVAEAVEEEAAEEESPVAEAVEEEAVEDEATEEERPDETP
jgi:small subunit ribosomal protein S1